MTILTTAQQTEFTQLASIGVLPFDALVVCGVAPTEAETLCSDPDILALHRRGRAEGAAKARKQLVKAGERGSVSALKALKLFEDTPEMEEALYPRRRPAAKTVQVDVIASVDSLFANQRKLFESFKRSLKMSKPVGRPKVVIDFQKALDFAGFGLNDEEIAKALGIGRATWMRYP